MKRLLLTTAVLALAAAPAFADEPDGLKLPAGFHASVVAQGLGAIRHIAVRDNGDLYVSTPRNRQGIGGGIVAIKMNPDHTAGQTEHFGVVDGGTGIRFYKGALYASSPGRVWRYTLPKGSLLPKDEPQVVVDGLPAMNGSSNRQITFDDKGNLYLGVSSSGNFCPDPNAPKTAPPVGLKPCPDLGKRAGIWKFSATKLNQQFPAGGEQLATGLRDFSSVDWSPDDAALYVIMHGRDDTKRLWPNVAITQADDDAIADEVHKVTKGTDVGWPYTYYDGVRKMRITAPEYGGDGKTAATGNYDVPAATFFGGRAAPVDLAFYTGKQFPAEYQGGAFVALHGTGGAQQPQGHHGYEVDFIPFGKSGVAGEPKVFADGFAGPTTASKNAGKAAYRPVGLAVAADGSLYVADSNKGRIWRITYGG